MLQIRATAKWLISVVPPVEISRSQKLAYARSHLTTRGVRTTLPLYVIDYLLSLIHI